MDGESCGGKGRVGDYRLCVGGDVTDFLIFWVARRKEEEGRRSQKGRKRAYEKHLVCSPEKTISFKKKEHVVCSLGQVECSVRNSPIEKDVVERRSLS